MPICKNRSCRQKFKHPFGGKFGKSFSDKQLMEKLCSNCIGIIHSWLDKNRSGDYDVGWLMFCYKCKKIDRSIDNVYEKDKKFCYCRNEHLDGLPYPAYNEDYDSHTDDMG